VGRSIFDPLLEYSGKRLFGWLIVFAVLVLVPDGSVLAEDVANQNCATILTQPESRTESVSLAANEMLTAASASRADIVYSHCVLLEATKFPAFRNQLRQLAIDSDLEGADLAAGISNVRLRAELLARLVEGALDAGYVNTPHLKGYVKEIREVAPNDLEMRAYADALEGRILSAAGNTDLARASLERALLLESERPLPSRLPSWFLALAETMPDKRREYIRAAYIALQNLRPLLPQRDEITGESSFSLRMRQIFESEIDVELSERGGSIDPQSLSRAQDVVEAYRQAEIRSAFGNDCVPPLSPMKPQVLRENEIILYPILLSDRLELLVATGEDHAYRRLPPDRSLDRHRIVPLIHRLRDAMTSDTNRNWQEPSQELYRALIQPIAKLLDPQKTLIIVPDGPLRLVPFAALTNSNGQSLIAQTRLAIAPALSYTQPGDENSGSDAWTIAAYLDRSVEVDGQKFSALQATPGEAAAAISSDLERSSIGQTIANFDRDDLEQALKQRKIAILHLATHASFSGRSDRSFLVAEDGRLDMSELRQMIARRHAHGGEIELLVLSACETALGDDEASMGFAGSAVQEGARAAIATLWDVNDPSTEKLMKVFYAHYRAGEARAQALREAQLEVAQQYPDPYFWAAFDLIGAWR
jgi:CHAT domain-containing protein